MRKKQHHEGNLQFTIHKLFKNRSCSQEAELQRLNFTKEKFKLIILSITD